MIKLPNIQEMTRSPVAWGALIVNLLPIGMVAFGGWSLSALVVLYWLENLVVGGVNVLRMGVSGVANGAGAIAAGLFTIPFFIVHYGMFCFVHGIFVLAMFGGEVDPETLQTSASVSPADGPLMLASSAIGIAPGMGAVLGVIALWKLGLFAMYFIRRGDYRNSNPAEHMMRPYGRIVFLHLAIFAGAFGLTLIGQPIWGVMALAAIKTLYDMFAEWREARARDAQSTRL